MVAGRKPRPPVPRSHLLGFRLALEMPHQTHVHKLVPRYRVLFVRLEVAQAAQPLQHTCYQDAFSPVQLEGFFGLLV